MVKEYMDAVLIDGKKCYVFNHRAAADKKMDENDRYPVVYMGIQKNSKKQAVDIDRLLTKTAEGQSFLFAVYEMEDWNSCFTPWYAEVDGGKRIFAGKGQETLQWLQEQCIPYMEANYRISDIPEGRMLAGYSLAGLFSLWVFYESGQFGAVASCSGSLWYPGWKEYIMKRTAPVVSRIYLSLGRKEEKSRNPFIAQVGEATRLQYEKNCRDDFVQQAVLEWHDGGHFHQTEQRIAQGINWILG